RCELCGHRLGWRRLYCCAWQRRGVAFPTRSLVGKQVERRIRWICDGCERRALTRREWVRIDKVLGMTVEDLQGLDIGEGEADAEPTGEEEAPTMSAAADPAQDRSLERLDPGALRGMRFLRRCSRRELSERSGINVKSIAAWEAGRSLGCGAAKVSLLASSLGTVPEVLAGVARLPEVDEPAAERDGGPWSRRAAAVPTAGQRPCGGFLRGRHDARRRRRGRNHLALEPADPGRSPGDAATDPGPECWSGCPGPLPRWPMAGERRRAGVGGGEEIRRPPGRSAADGG